MITLTTRRLSTFPTSTRARYAIVVSVLMASTSGCLNAATVTPDDANTAALPDGGANGDTTPVAASAQCVLVSSPVIDQPRVTSLWDGTAWSTGTGTDMPSISGGAAVASFAGSVIAFGGQTQNAMLDGLTSDTWSWSGSAWTQLHPLTSPGARHGAMVAELNGSLLLFGGGASSPLNDTWEWNGSNWIQRSPVHSPPPRYYGAMATLHGHVVLFGGVTHPFDDTANLSDTWEWDGVDWTPRVVTSTPAARSFAAAHTVGDRVVLFGGLGNGAQGALADTWTWDGASWVALAPAHSPGGRWQAVSAVNNGRMVVYGGIGPIPRMYRTMWQWDGTDWTEDVEQGPDYGVLTAIGCL